MKRKIFSIPAQLAKENKKFQYKVIKSGARAYEYETAIDWLVTSGVARQMQSVLISQLFIILKEH